jgi:hypothetical protein
MGNQPLTVGISIDIRAIGLDVAGDNQPLHLMRYPEWAEQGYSYGWVEWFRDGNPVRDAAGHTQAMHSAGMLVGAYLNLSHGDASGQMRRFLANAPAGDLPDMLDVEEETLTEDDVREATDVHNLSGRQRLCVYTGYWNWLIIVPSLEDRLRYQPYDLVLGSYPYDMPAGQPTPMDPVSVARRTTPPPISVLPGIPHPWQLEDLLSWQHSGQASLSGYPEFIDVHVSRLTAAQMRARFVTTAGLLTPAVAAADATLAALKGLD